MSQDATDSDPVPLILPSMAGQPTRSRSTAQRVFVVTATAQYPTAMAQAGHDGGAAVRGHLADYGPSSCETSVLSMCGGATQDIGIDALDSAIGAVLADYTAYPWPAAAEGDSLEEVLAVDPAHIWVLDFGFDRDAPALVESLADNPVWQELTAVQSGTVHTADSDWWGTAAGTRAQQLLLDEVMPAVYAEEFPEPLSGLPASR